MKNEREDKMHDTTVVNKEMELPSFPVTISLTESEKERINELNAINHEINKTFLEGI